jgi:periplasmic protein TonB
MTARVGSGPSFRHPALPFGVAPEDLRRWRRTAARCLAPALVFALVLPWLPRPAVDPPAPPPAIVAVARVLIAPQPAPSPPARRVPTAPEATSPKSAAPSNPAREVQSRARPAVVVPEARRPEAQRPPGERDRERPAATGMGLLALKQQLADIHGAPAAVQLQAPVHAGPGVGQRSGPGVGAGSEPGQPLRALITAQGVAGSGGIGNAAFSRDSGGGGLAGRATTLVAGVAGGSGGGGAGGGGVGVPGRSGAVAGSGRGGAGGSGGSGKEGAAGRASRSIEDIKLVFDRHKGAIHALYNRALRDEPALQGKVVLELKIAPGGDVVDCRIVASDLKAAELERKLLARVRQFDFGAKDVQTMVVSWPVDFLPS